MDLKDNCTIYKQGDFQVKSNNYLHLLYAPLIKNDACILYGVLSSLDGKSLSLDNLLMILSWHTNRLEKARKTLEQFSLIKTFYHSIKREWIFEVYPPLNVNQFLTHDTYSRMFLNECGSMHFDLLKCMFNDELEKDGFVEISEKMDFSRLESWTEKKEESLLKLRPQEQELTCDFDFDTFLNGADRIFPVRYRTKENLTRIANLASIYGINALDMRKYVSRSINPSTKVFDVEKLKKFIYANSSIVESYDDPYKLSPVKFLMNKQKGAPVSTADKKLIENLVMDYGFSNEVMNILIEYCLNQTNQQFQKVYVEKVAASWIRLEITSKEKALAHIKSERKPKTKQKQLPDWYADTKQNKPDEDLMKEALELQRQLKGES